MIWQTCWEMVGVSDKGIEPVPSHRWADHRIAAVGFPVGDVVEKGGQFHDQEIGSLGLADPLGHLPDTVDVPPIVAAAFARECGLHVVGGAGDKLS